MTKKPAIAIIVPGGIGIDDNIPVLLELLCRIAELFDVTVYSFSKQETHPSLTSSQCIVMYAPGKIKSSLLKALFFIWKIRKDHSIKQFVLIHGFWIMQQGIVAVISGKLFNIPSIVTLPGGDITYVPEIQYGNYSNPIKRTLIAWCIHHASHIVTLTQFQKSLMQQRGMSRERMSIIPYGVDISKFQFRPHAFTEPLQLIYIGNLNRVKDPWTLLKTFQALTKKCACRLTVIGSGVLSGQVQEFSRALGVYDDIQWMGKLRHENIPPQLSTADILLMTSLYEGQSVVVLEAFASGVIVVGTRVGMLADIGNDAVTVSPGDVDGLTRKIEELIHHPETVSTLQLMNRKYAEMYSAEWTFKECIKLYNELIIQKQP
jgi:glycosyltransferase involved in cell wall biosynthesis